MTKYNICSGLKLTSVKFHKLSLLEIKFLSNAFMTNLVWGHLYTPNARVQETNVLKIMMSVPGPNDENGNTKR